MLQTRWILGEKVSICWEWTALTWVGSETKGDVLIHLNLKYFQVKRLKCKWSYESLAFTPKLSFKHFMILSSWVWSHQICQVQVMWLESTPLVSSACYLIYLMYFQHHQFYPRLTFFYIMSFNIYQLLYVEQSECSYFVPISVENINREEKRGTITTITDYISVGWYYRPYWTVADVSSSACGSSICTNIKNVFKAGKTAWTSDL